MSFATQRTLGLGSCGQLLFALVDDVVLKASWNGRVAGQFHSEGPLALGHASQVGGITEGICERDFCGDVGDHQVSIFLRPNKY